MATSTLMLETAPVRDSSSLTSSKIRKLKGIGLDFTHNDGIGQRLSTRLAKKYDALLSESLSVEEVARKIEVAPSVVEAKLTSTQRTLYGVQLASEWRILAFQLCEDGLLPGLEQVIPRIHPDLHPVAFAHWFLKVNPDLVDTNGNALSPREWLRLGYRPSCVATLAKHLDTL